MPRLPPDTNSVLPLSDVIRRTPVSLTLGDSEYAGRFFLLPPPLWGRVGEGGGRESGACRLPLSLALPHKGGGNDRARVRNHSYSLPRGFRTTGTRIGG